MYQEATFVGPESTLRIAFEGRLDHGTLVALTGSANETLAREIAYAGPGAWIRLAEDVTEWHYVTSHGIGERVKAFQESVDRLAEAGDARGMLAEGKRFRAFVDGLTIAKLYPNTLEG